MNTVEICNLALDMNGINNIVSLDENNNNARLVKHLFPVCRDRVLRDHFWSFATKAADLARLDAASFDPEYKFVCALPGDLLRIVSIVPDQRYRKAGKTILVNHLPARLIYIFRVEDAESFDANFCEALRYDLAREICQSVSKDASQIQIFTRGYLDALAVARSIDTDENSDMYPVRQRRRSSWIASR